MAARWWGWIVVCALMPSAALAQGGNDEQARVHFESGRLYFDRGEYERALTEFNAAYELSHRAVLLYNLGTTLERLGRYGQAADRLEQYLASNEPIDAAQRANLTARARSLRSRGGGGLGPLGISGIIALGAGGAGLVAFAITGGLALGEDSSVTARCGTHCTLADVSTLSTLVTVADVLLYSSLIVAAAGGALLVIDLVGSGGGGGEHAALVPIVTPTYAGLALGGTL